MSQEDLDAIRLTMLDFAGKQIGQHGGFAPFGASISSDGKMALSKADSESDDPEERLTGLLQGFCEKADSGEIRAAGYCVEMRPEDAAGGTKEVDAIYVCLEDGEPWSRKFVYPLKRTKSGYKLGSATTEDGEAIIFITEEGEEE